jgi:hypothetical protein
MAQAEDRLIELIRAAFPGAAQAESDLGFANLPDHDLARDPWFLEESGDIVAFRVLPRYLIYVLRTFRERPQSMVYMKVLDILHELGKRNKSTQVALRPSSRLTPSQMKAVRAFLKHLLHNQPVNLDVAELTKSLANWNWSDRLPDNSQTDVVKTAQEKRREP